MLKYLKTFECKGMIFASLLPLSLGKNFDNVEIGEKGMKEKPSEGWQRLQKMFRVDEFGDVSDELTIISQTAMVSSFVGFIYGGVMNSKTAYSDFMRQNTASSFTSHLEAKRRLQDTITKSFSKGAFKWGWRLCLFSTSFVALSTMVSVYRGKSGISEYVVGGAATGALYKWQMGPRGWVVGGALGGVLGLFSGSVSYGLLQLSGFSMGDIRKRQAHLGIYREDLLRKGMQNKEEEDDPLLKVLRKNDESVKEDTSKI